MSSTATERPPIPDPAPVAPSRLEDDRRPRASVEAVGGLPFLPRTLRAQVIVPVVLVAILGALLVSRVALMSAEDHYRDQLDETVIAGTSLLASFAAANIPAGAAPGDPAAQALVDLVARSTGGIATVAARDGTVIADSLTPAAETGNIRLNAAVIDALQSGSGLESGRATADGSTYRFQAVLVPVGGGDPGTDLVVRLGLPVSPIEAEIAEIERIVWVGCAIAIAATAVTLWFVTRRVEIGLRRVAVQAERLASHDYSPDPHPAPLVEFAAVRMSLNGMALELRDVLAEVRHARAQLESTLATLLDGVVLTDRTGSVLRINAAAERMLGVSADDVVGMPFVFATRDYELGDLQRRSMESGQIAQKTGIELGFDRRQIDAIAQPVVDDEDQLTLVVLRDQTELRRLEQVRREFVANVSHELRTPLASIRAMVETLEAGALDEPEIAYDFLARIVTEVERLATLVDELLDLARLESGRLNLHLERLDSADLIESGAGRLLPQVERARLGLEIALADGLPPVVADRNRVEQVLLNLVHNAIKFTPPGGTITITGRQEGDALVVSVRDTGVGIAPEELPRLFERFYKADRARRSEGTGLGLAIAKHIVGAHGGTITADSQPGRGSTFTFTLPVATPDGFGGSR